MDVIQSEGQSGGDFVHETKRKESFPSTAVGPRRPMAAL
jgi:hypothetical protein